MTILNVEYKPSNGPSEWCHPKTMDSFKNQKDPSWNTGWSKIVILNKTKMWLHVYECLIPSSLHSLCLGPGRGGSSLSRDNQTSQLFWEDSEVLLKATSWLDIPETPPQGGFYGTFGTGLWTTSADSSPCEWAAAQLWATSNWLSFSGYL